MKIQAKIQQGNEMRDENLVGLFMVGLRWGARRPASQAAMENPKTEGRWFSYL